MKDIRLEKLADVLVNYSTEVKKGDFVVVQGSAMASPLLKEIYALVLKNGANAVLRVSLPWTSETFYKIANNEQLDFIPRTAWLETRTIDAYIGISAPANTKNLSKVDSSKQSRLAKAHHLLDELFMKRAAMHQEGKKGGLRWVIADFPCDSLAQDADMSLDDYEKFVFESCFADKKDPVGEWKKVSKTHNKLIKYLRNKKEIHVKSEDTDLKLRVDKRKFINCDGHYNMPDGEVFTGPIENSANGHIKYTFPAVHGGKEVAGINLEFKNGEVVKASAAKNEEYLLKMLATDKGAKYIGEFAIATNYNIKNFSKNILFDEKIGGTVHLAVGMGYPESGSKNKSAIHWDMICDLRKSGEIKADNETFFRNGKILV